jgi:hypothetical protein
LNIATFWTEKVVENVDPSELSIPHGVLQVKNERKIAEEGISMAKTPFSDIPNPLNFPLYCAICILFLFPINLSMAFAALRGLLE